MNRHQYRLHVFKETYEDGSFEYVAEYPEIAGVMGVGDSPEEAVKEAESAKNAYLAYLKEMKKPYPKALNLDKLSGRVTFRMSKSLHKKVVERAEIENVSINQLINEAVNAYVCSNDTIEKAIDRISSMKNV